MLTRRDLIEGIGATALLAALGETGIAFASQPVPMRPPGAQSETSFMATCIRCDRCRSVCPTNAIGVSTIEEGLIGLRTPKMEFRIGHCNECAGSYLCANVCPTGAIGSFDKTKEEIGVAVIDQSKCLTYGISGKCSANCIPACPEEALSIRADGRLVLNESACWGCGACEYFCASDAYGSYEKTGNRGINIERREQ